MQADVVLIRGFFTLILVTAGYLIQPIPDWVATRIGLPGTAAYLSAGIALVLALGIIYFELRIRRASLKTLIGAAIGSTLGIIGSTLIGFLISAQHWDPPIRSFVTLLLTLFMAVCWSAGWSSKRRLPRSFCARRAAERPQSEAEL